MKRLFNRAATKAPTTPSPTLTPRRRFLRALKRICWSGIGLYLTLLLFLFFGQRPLLFPGSVHQGTAQTMDAAPRGVELITLRTKQGETVAAFFGSALTPAGLPDPAASREPTLLFFYGNGGCIRDYEPQMDIFRRLGANVLIPEFVGYGMSTGTASEAGCYATADAAYDYLLARPGIDRSRIVDAGQSLGSAVAIDLAARRPAAGLVTFSAFTSMAEMGNHQYPIVPTPIIRLLLKHQFTNERKMPKIACPTLICHGGADSLVPPSMALRLSAAAGGPVTRLMVDKAGHGDIFATGGPQIYPVLTRFLQTVPRMRN